MIPTTVARTALRTARTQLVRGAKGADYKPAAESSALWGTSDFGGGINWRGNGALPFKVSNKPWRKVWVYMTIGFGLPFAITEWRIAPQRKAYREERAAARAAGQA
ncbi:hypothetical protein HDV00_011195 [Rhizophlyctis rosea]|nr:hypothetical protein HDV00_011195 [Rhizophlyctis rosea]